MPQLAAPDVRLHTSYIEALEEFRAEGRGTPGDDSSVGRALRDYSATWRDPEAFAEYVAKVSSTAGILRKVRVPSTTLWYAEGDTYLGRLAIRHELDDWLRDFGGHIGYDIRPTARRRGHATRMLRASLPFARRLGLDSVLVTCDADNTGSRKVIEACGGVFEDQRGEKLRYWFRTGSERPADAS